MRNEFLQNSQIKNLEREDLRWFIVGPKYVLIFVDLQLWVI